MGVFALKMHEGRVDGGGEEEGATRKYARYGRGSFAGRRSRRERVEKLARLLLAKES